MLPGIIRSNSTGTCYKTFTHRRSAAIIRSRPRDVVPHLLHNFKACGNLHAHTSNVTILCNVELLFHVVFPPSRPSDAAMHSEEQDCDIAEHLLGTGHAMHTCHANRRRLRELRVMWAVRAASLPLDMAGTREAAVAHSTTMPAPAYKWGPGNSLPENHKGLSIKNWKVLCVLCNKQHSCS